MAIVIYHLERNGVPFYVGQSSRVEKRIYEHKNRRGEEFDYKLIYTCLDDDCPNVIESFFIMYYIKLGFKLENKTYLRVDCENILFINEREYLRDLFMKGNMSIFDFKEQNALISQKRYNA